MGKNRNSKQRFGSSFPHEMQPTSDRTANASRQDERACSEPLPHPYAFECVGANWLSSLAHDRHTGEARVQTQTWLTVTPVGGRPWTSAALQLCVAVTLELSLQQNSMLSGWSFGSERRNQEFYTGSAVTSFPVLKVGFDLLTLRRLARLCACRETSFLTVASGAHLGLH